MAPMYVLLAALVIAAPATVFAQEGEAAPREAVPRGSRPQDDNPRTGTAIRRSAPAPNPPREAAPPPRVDNRGGAVERGRDDRRDDRGRTVVVPDRRRTVIVRSPNIYNHYDPRNRYPYGYGAFGLGYFYYDPYRWSGAGAYPYNTFDVGELRLDVSPRHAQVFVDGYYAGVVDEFDGAFQALKLSSGGYRIDISAPGYETLTFDVRINPGQDVRYRGALRRY